MTPDPRKCGPWSFDASGRARCGAHHGLSAGTFIDLASDRCDAAPDPRPEHPQPCGACGGHRHQGEECGYVYSIGEVCTCRWPMQPCEAEPGERVHARPSEPVTYSLALLNAEAKRLRENADAYERCANEPASDLRQKLVDVERAASALRGQREAGTRTEGGEKLAALADAPRLPRDEALLRRAIAWRNGGDTGLSSVALVSFFMGWPIDGGGFHHDTAHPGDPEDLGRCVRALDRLPELGARLHEARALSPTWSALIDAWDELVGLFRKEWPSGRAPLCYARMRAIQDAAREPKAEERPQDATTSSPSSSSPREKADG